MFGIRRATKEFCATLSDILDENSRLKAENESLRTERAKLRELVLKNWYIALSEREALRTHGIDPDDGAYITALDDEIAIAKDCMRELEIEIDD